MTAPPGGRATSGSTAAPDDRAITVVLGMHRSGTSLTSHLLTLLGLDMADEITPDANNPRGHWERWEIVRMNDEVLHFFGQGFYDPTHARPLPPRWWTDPHVQAVRDRIAAWLEAKMTAVSPAAFGLKEPRIGRLFPMWAEIFARLGLRPRFVYCIRRPEAVAASLARRDGFAPSEGLLRWLVYNTDIILGLGEQPVTVIPYDGWATEPDGTMARLAQVAQRRDLDATALRRILAEGFDPLLRHHLPAEEAERPGVCAQLYGMLARHRDPGPLLPELRLAARLCAGFEEILSPLQVELDRLKAAD
ncbi:sulfotransferase family protein [Acidisoma sp. 7E03]